ncbi:GNAT family N-acetyltransferase [Marinifilum flexuosum]|uniref:GNAT family N-acetyltransferase n=1 Tax=Marinifilum flexuosum TaxID=1117708 RepID=UPI00248F7C9E|nr:GNAT family N-acetyltransferase [Marinifilum flexuosum]
MPTLSDICHFNTLTPEIDLSTFDCEHPDLNEFFKDDARDYSEKLLGKSYIFTLDENPDIVVGAFTVSNDSLRVSSLGSSRKNKIRKKFPRGKHLKNYPAVLIGRLGVHKDFKGLNYGSEILDFIKMWFTEDNNKTGCRFIIVDAYNIPPALKFYEKNGFKFLHSSERTEKQHLGYTESKKLDTRFMYFDLMQFCN